MEEDGYCPDPRQEGSPTLNTLPQAAESRDSRQATPGAKAQRGLEGGAATLNKALFHTRLPGQKGT